MSSMLEQAIADAAALREQAIKNAEQSVLDKYSKQIKEAVDQMLEMDDAPARAQQTISEIEDELMQEEDLGMGGDSAGSEAPAAVEAPPAWDSRFNDISMKLTAMVDNLPEDENGMVELDLGDFSVPEDEAAAANGSPESDLGGSISDLESAEASTPTEEGGDDLESLLGDLENDSGEDEQLQEVYEVLEDLLGESVEVDYDPIADSLGKWRNNRSREEFNQDMADVVYGDEESSKEESESEDEEVMGKINELHETIDNLSRQNKQLESVLSKIEMHLEETLLSNAKLLYQNRTLSDASLNERQKQKIVEAIANAESPKEAKTLHETLRATVGSSSNNKKGPQSLSESVNRKSNLSSMLNSRQNINESKDDADPFMEKMQRLAGIKKQ
jgi:hypothetical protein